MDVNAGYEEIMGRGLASNFSNDFNNGSVGLLE